MAREGIVNVEDLAEFDKDGIQQLADNLRRPGGRIPDPDPGAEEGATIPTPAFVFGVRSHRRLLAATNLLKYYETTGREVTVANIQWNTVIKNFDIQWQALKTKQDEDAPDVPKISKSLPVIKWTESFQDFLNRVVGVRTMPLCCVVRPEEEVPNNPPLLSPGQPHSTEHGSVEAELIARASHDHALFRDDNASVYHYLEEATRSTNYAASIKPFQRAKNGRGAWEALVRQYAGRDKWIAEIKRQEDLLHTRVWKGQSNFSLESFIAQHRNAFVSMQQCAEHVFYQLPNEHSRVGYLLEAIQCLDPGLQAGMAAVRGDLEGMRVDFELAAAHLLPYDPVAKKRTSGNKRTSAMISDVSTQEPEVASTHGGKTSIGKTGVHLRWHTDAEYKKLNAAQRKELYEWREANPQEKEAQLSSKPKKSKKTSYTKRQLASLVSKRVKLELTKKQEAQDEEAAIMSLIEQVKATEVTTKKPPASASAVASTAHDHQTAASALRSILKKAKGQE